MPMGPDTYLRLFERANESMWPWQIPVLVLGAAAIGLLWRNRVRPAWLILGLIWILVAVFFHHRFFAELNWAADYFAWIFVAQGVLFLALTLKPGQSPGFLGYRLQRRFGLILATIGLVVYPILALISERSWTAAEVFGVAPDPTCLVTMGALLIGLRRPWWQMLLPLAWSLITAAIGLALNLVSGLIPLACGIVCLVFVLLPDRFRQSI